MIQLAYSQKGEIANGSRFAQAELDLDFSQVS